jgi:hypothetical protein
MKGKFFMLLTLVFILIAAGFQGTASGDTCNLCHEFGSSLHHSARGMEYWYSAENGGLETITGYPYSAFNHPTAGCRNCHAKNCAKCHGVDDPTGPPSGTPGDWQTSICLPCHARESAMIAKDDASGTPDVHRAAGMKCTDCHSHREIHGDGVEYISFKELGAMDTECETCHNDESLHPVPNSRAHTIHGDKLDCKACHERRVVSCYNCHMDTAGPSGPGNRIAKAQLTDWVFLINYKGKVTSANMQTFIGGDPGNTINGPNDKTFLFFAPVHSHSIMSQGRGCGDCHATQITDYMKNHRALPLTYLSSGGVFTQVKGVIPVVDTVKYRFISYDKDNFDTTPSPPGPTWTAHSTYPLEADGTQFNIGFGTPLTLQQASWLTFPQIP